MSRDYDPAYVNNTDDDAHGGAYDPEYVNSTEDLGKDRYDAWTDREDRAGKAWEDRRESPGNWDSHE